MISILLYPGGLGIPIDVCLGNPCQHLSDPCLIAQMATPTANTDG
ncbi:MAG: hypothetical protein ACTHYC_00900 [Sphingobacterium sp.]